MENKSIEESAIEFAFGKHCVRICTDSNGNRVVWKCSNLADGCSCEQFEQTCEQYVEIATEQDRIARAEERERCIKAVQEWHCTESCWGYDKDNRICKGCDFWNNVRKAIEEGGEG